MGTVGRRWSKPVRDLDTGLVYSNVREAATALGVSHTTLYRHLNGTYLGRHGRKLNVRWEVDWLGYTGKKMV